MHEKDLFYHTIFCHYFCAKVNVEKNLIQVRCGLFTVSEHIVHMHSCTWVEHAFYPV